MKKHEASKLKAIFLLLPLFFVSSLNSNNFFNKNIFEKEFKSETTSVKDVNFDLNFHVSFNEDFINIENIDKIEENNNFNLKKEQFSDNYFLIDYDNDLVFLNEEIKSAEFEKINEPVEILLKTFEETEENNDVSFSKIIVIFIFVFSFIIVFIAFGILVVFIIDRKKINNENNMNSRLDDN